MIWRLIARYRQRRAGCRAVHPDPEYPVVCLLNVGHGGDCDDGDGHTWTRKDIP